MTANNFFIVNAFDKIHENKNNKVVSTALIYNITTSGLFLVSNPFKIEP